MRKIRALDFLNPSIFFLSMYLFSLGGVFILDELISYIFGVRIVSIEVSSETKIILFIYIVSFLLSSYVLTPLFFGYRPAPPNKEINSVISTLSIKVYCFLLILIFLLVHVYYFAKIGFFPALSPDVGTVRVTAKSGFGGALLLANGAIYTVALLVGSIYRHLSNWNRFIWIVLIVSTGGVMGLTGFRGPTAGLFLLFLMAIYFGSSNYRASRKIGISMITFGIVFVVLLSAIDWLRSGNSISFDMLFQTYWTMTVNVFNLEQIVNYVNQHDYFYGSTFINDLAVVFPGVHSKFFGVEMVNILGLEFDGEGMTVTAPGEGFANFGIPGVMVHAMFLGLLSELAFRYFTKQGYAHHISVLVFIGFCIAKIPAAGIMPIVIFVFIPTAFFIFPFLYLVRFSARSS